MRLYGIAFILAGIIMLVITVVQWLKFLSFRDCEVTTATVMGVDSRKHYNKGMQRTSYSIRVAYNIDGNAYERNLACDSEEYKLGANRQVEIRYKSHNPKKILLNAHEKQARGMKIQSFPVFMLTVSIPKNRGFLQ